MKLIDDIEIFYNLSFFGFKNFETKETFSFEISEYVNQSQEFYDFLLKLDKNNVFFISFNGIDYDNLVINYFFKHYNVFKQNNFTPLDICLSLKEFSDYVINCQDSHNDSEIKKYKYHNKWIDIDLFRYWSKMLRKSKKISLKSLGIQLNHDRVQELPYHFNKILTKEERDNVKDYNVNNDLVITDKLCNELKSEIIQRQDANDKYKFNSWSWDGVKLGLNILLNEYCKKYNYNREDINSLRGKLEPMKIERLILDKISFTKTEEIIRPETEDGKITYYCNSFYTLLNHLKNRVVTSTDELSYSVILNEVKYDIKSGGLHSYHNSEIINPNLNIYKYIDCDVSSMYPTLGATYRYTPSHLPGMDTLIEDLKTFRIKCKKEGNKKDAELFKKALNGGFYGMLNNVYTPMYDPKMLLSITLNGQMFLLMLCEKFIEAGIKIDMVNTDGISAIIPKELENKYNEICKEWESLSLMELEYESFEKVIRKNINNYLAITTSGKVKRKGLFKLDFNEKGEREIPLGDSCNALIIPKALNNYFVKGIPIEETINNPEKYNCTIFDYLYSQKISKDYEVYWNNKLQQNLNRYYIGDRTSPYLYKKKKTKTTMENVLKGFGVELYNNHLEKPFKDYKVNTQYYIAKTREILYELEPQQQNLFE
jgi:hypothetical protein